MLLRLRHNLFLKLLALAFAIALHVYAAGQQSPRVTRQLGLPLDIRNLPPGLLIDDRTPPPSQVFVTLDGPSDAAGHGAMSAHAYLDLSHAHAGKNSLRVNVDLPASFSGEEVGLEAEPPPVTLTLTPKVRRAVTVTAGDPGVPPVGYGFRTQIRPRAAAVVGSAAAVQSVSHLVAKVEGGGTVNGEFPLMALDEHGGQVSDVQVVPATARVRIAMVRVPSTRTLVVSYNVVGQPPYPYKIMDVQVTPRTVTVSGRPDQLSSSTTVTTTPVDVSGVTTDVTRQVMCVPPPGLTVLGAPAVSVTVHIAVPPSPATPPSSTPAAPPGAAPAR